jgi:hypothetical protein
MLKLFLQAALANQSTARILPAIAISSGLPGSLLNCPIAVSMTDLNGYNLPGGDRYRQAIQQFYNGSDFLTLSGQETIQSVMGMRSRLPFNEDGSLKSYQPANGANYPTETGAEFGNQLKLLAQLLKIEVGLQVATLSYGDWDTHEDQTYRFPELVKGLSQALSAFYRDVGGDHVTIVVMSEFGRRLKANQSGGTDHGHGGVILVMGGSVKGGQIYGQWPGLANEQLDRGADLAITTDYRTVLSEVLLKHRPSLDLGAVFANFTAQPLGLLS